MNINNNINNLLQKVPAGCRLIAVSKTQSVERIMEAYQCGLRVFGENKVQEIAAKHGALPSDIEWHMIGHLQTNKVRQVLPLVRLIHGVDSEKLLREINKEAGKAGLIARVLLQIFIAREETKFGFSEDEVLALIESGAMKSLQNTHVAGLMGMATFTDDKEQVRGEFRRLRHFFETLRDRNLPPNMKMEELSMGMSGDYEIAIEEGSTMVRIGTAIFGSRN